MTLVPSVFEYDYGISENVSFTVHFIDQISGVQSASVALKSDASICTTLQFNLVNGTIYDGFWQAFIVFEDSFCYSTITFTDFSVGDFAGNFHYLPSPGHILFSSM